LIYHLNTKARADVNGRQVLKILEKAGWQVARIRGSHHRMTKGGAATTVPIHGAKDLDPKVLRNIERDTGVKLR
jgi:predicted RNA binding protein YcfA (HicA-like mRNA interferase family)